MEEARGLGERRLEAEALRRLGWLHLRTGKCEEALQLSERALALFREVGIYAVDPIVRRSRPLQETRDGRADAQGGGR